MSTLKRLHRQAKARRSGRPAFTLLELIVVLLVLGILAAIAVPTFNRVKENSVQRVAQTTLEAAARNGEAIARSDGDATDEQIAAAVEAEFSDENGLTVSVSGDTVTVTQTKGSIAACGTVGFVSGIAEVTDANPAGCSSGGGSSSTTTSTAVSTTTTSTLASTTTTAAPTSYAVGDTGPGGGIVFAVFNAPFTCGPTMNLTCTYLEVAPYGWNGNGGEEPALGWSNTTNTLLGSTSTGLGYGHQNTLAAMAQNATAGRAVTLAPSYEHNGKSDWYLPSRVELNELCKYARQQTTGTTSQACNTSGSLRAEFANAAYWSSTEATAANAWRQSFSTGSQSNAAKANSYRVRPIRAG